MQRIVRKYMSVNWDVDEMVAKKEGGLDEKFLTLGLSGAFGTGEVVMSEVV